MPPRRRGHSLTAYHLWFSEHGLRQIIPYIGKVAHNIQASFAGFAEKIDRNGCKEAKWKTWAEMNSSTGVKPRKGERRPLSAAQRDSRSEAIWIIGVPARRDADVGQAEQTFDGRPFADIVPLGAMADPLQQIAGNDRSHAPIPGQEKEQDDAADSQRNADQMDIKIEGQAMPLAPIPQTATEEAQDGPAPPRRRGPFCRLRIRVCHHIRSTVRIPKRSRPRWITRAVKSQSNSRLCRNGAVSALSTGQFWKKPLYVLAKSQR